MTSTPQGRCDYVDADIRDIDQILNSKEVTTTIDLNQPVGIVCASVLMLLSDHDNPGKLVTQLRDWAPPGSYLAISHPTADHDQAAVAEVVATTKNVGITFVPRTREQVAAMFGDWRMVDPGLVPVLAWRPDDAPDDPKAAYYWAGVAAKPLARSPD